jgi:hypothetical protein
LSTTCAPTQTAALLSSSIDHVVEKNCGREICLVE